MDQLTLKDTQSLVSAKQIPWHDHSGYPIPVYDDGFGPLWIHRDSMGISGIVRAQTYQDAYEICEDEFFPSCDRTHEEIVAEYGSPDPEAWSENELFCEAYGFRPNGRGGPTPEIDRGIYAKDLNGDRLDPLTPELCRELRIKLTVLSEE